MSRITFVWSLIFSSLLCTTPTASAEEGPLQSPLRVVRMYTGDANDRIYVEFNAGAMPGCYADSGGRLYVSDVFYESVYSQLLVIVATGGITGRVVYENIAGSGWTVCKIKGLDLRP